MGHIRFIARGEGGVERGGESKAEFALYEESDKERERDRKRKKQREGEGEIERERCIYRSYTYVETKGM